MNKKKYWIVCVVIVFLFSCSDDSQKYVGVFKTLNKHQIVREITIKHIRENKYKIIFIDGAMIQEGTRRENRITAMFKDDPILVEYGKVPDSTIYFYDFNPDGNEIKVTTDDMNNIETYIRIR